MAQHDTGHFSADDEYLSTPPGAGYEHTDAHTGAIVKYMLWLAIAAILVHFGMGYLFTSFVNSRAVQGEQTYPLATANEPRLPPAPRLQRFPRAEIAAFRADEEAILGSYGWVSRPNNVVRIPIAEAMKLTVERGLPSRAQDGTTPAATPGMIPSDSSSGRVLEHRRQ